VPQRSAGIVREFHIVWRVVTLTVVNVLLTFNFLAEQYYTWLLVAATRHTYVASLLKPYSLL